MTNPLCQKVSMSDSEMIRSRHGYCRPFGSWIPNDKNPCSHSSNIHITFLNQVLHKGKRKRSDREKEKKKKKPKLNKRAKYENQHVHDTFHTLESQEVGRGAYGTILSMYKKDERESGKHVIKKQGYDRTNNGCPTFGIPTHVVREIMILKKLNRLSFPHVPTITGMGFSEEFNPSPSAVLKSSKGIHADSHLNKKKESSENKQWWFSSQPLCDADLSVFTSSSFSSRNSSPPLTVQTTKKIMYKLLRILGDLHECDIIHRDIKPSNILIKSKEDSKISLTRDNIHNAKDFDIYLCDFGLARLELLGMNNMSSKKEFEARNVLYNTTNDSASHSPTTTTTTTPSMFYHETNVCTTHYRAPEIFLESLVYTDSIDIWSAGCIFYELLTGCVLFEPPTRRGSADINLFMLAKIFTQFGFPPQDYAKSVPCLEDYRTTILANKGKKIRVKRPEHRLSDLKNPSMAEARDLLLKMLNVDPRERISARDALNDPFFDSVRRRDDDHAATGGIDSYAVAHSAGLKTRSRIRPDEPRSTEPHPKRSEVVRYLKEWVEKIERDHNQIYSDDPSMHVHVRERIFGAVYIWDHFIAGHDVSKDDGGYDEEDELLNLKRWAKAAFILFLKIDSNAITVNDFCHNLKKSESDQQLLEDLKHRQSAIFFDEPFRGDLPMFTMWRRWTHEIAPSSDENYEIHDMVYDAFCDRMIDDYGWFHTTGEEHEREKVADILTSSLKLK